MEGFNRSEQIIYRCIYHVVWCTKYRRNVLTESIAARIKEVISEACNLLNAEMKDLDIGSNYVKITVGVAPQTGIHKVVKRLKTQTFSVIKEEYPSIKSKLPTLWTNSYFVTTDQDITPEMIEQYISSQPNTWRK